MSIRASNKARLLPLAILVGVLGSFLGQSGCGTTTGNPLVTLEFGAYTAKSWFNIIPEVYAGVSSVTFCFKRIRFKPEGRATSADKTQDPDNQDFKTGEVTLSSTGTKLNGVNVANGVYRRIEFDLEPDGCASGKSIQLANDNGVFSSDASISIRFDGTFTLSGSERTLALSIQTIMSELNAVASNGDIKIKAELSAGVFND